MEPSKQSMIAYSTVSQSNNAEPIDVLTDASLSHLSKVCLANKYVAASRNQNLKLNKLFVGVSYF